ncbi:hypothetical protein ACO2I3_04315 [Leptospira interrogans]
MRVDLLATVMLPATETQRAITSGTTGRYVADARLGVMALSAPRAHGSARRAIAQIGLRGACE